MAIKSLQHSSLTDNIFYRSMLAGNTAFEPSDEDILAEQVLASSAASVTFSGLDAYAAQGYQHLQLRMVAQTTDSVTARGLQLQLNSDTGSNYSYHRLQGTGSSVISNAGTSQTFIAPGQVAGQSAGTNSFSPHVIDILDPFSTNKYTTLRSLYGDPATVDRRVGLNSGLWMSTNAVTSLRFFTLGNFVTGSRFTLIGLK